MSKIKMVISEVDGIITDGKSLYDNLGIPIAKNYCFKDFEAINMIKKLGIGFCFLSSEDSITNNLCRKKNIKYYSNPNNKKAELIKILKFHSLSPDSIIYLGCLYSDLACISLAGTGAVPKDAVNKAIALSDIVLNAYSGEGVLCDLYEYIIGIE